MAAGAPTTTTTTCTVVVDLAQARARRERAGAGERLLAQVERELAGVRARMTALLTAGALFERGGGREGRRLLLAQEALLEARRMLLEATGGGALPAPRQDATRERLVAWAAEHVAQARRRLGPLAPSEASPLPLG